MGDHNGFRPMAMDNSSSGASDHNWISSSLADEVPIVCYAPSATTLNGIFHDHIFSNPIVLFLTQLAAIVFITRTVAFLLRPFSQPTFISQVIGGLLLGPMVMGKIPGFHDYFFPLRSVLVLETLAQLGLIYHVFTIAVDVDLNVLGRAGGRSVILTTVCMTGPLIAGSLSGLALRTSLDTGVASAPAFVVFFGIALSVTAISSLARCLADMKMLSSPLGYLALSASITLGCLTWILLIITVSLAHVRHHPRGPIYSTLSGIALVLAAFAIVRPVARWASRQAPAAVDEQHHNMKGAGIDDAHACFFLVGVMVWAIAADVFGTHAIFGAFTFGLAIPCGPLGSAMVDRIDGFVEGLLLPFFFVITGLRTDLSYLFDGDAAVILAAAIVTAAALKVGGCLIVAMSFDMPVEEGLTLGLLMNAKGVMDLIVLNVGMDKKVIGHGTYSVFVLLTLALAAGINPELAAAGRPRRSKAISYKLRGIQWQKRESELRLLACIHNTSQVPAIVTLLQLSNPMKRAPIFVYALCWLFSTWARLMTWP